MYAQLISGSCVLYKTPSYGPNLVSFGIVVSANTPRPELKIVDCLIENPGGVVAKTWSSLSMSV